MATSKGKCALHTLKHRIGDWFFRFLAAIHVHASFPFLHAVGKRNAFQIFLVHFCSQQHNNTTVCWRYMYTFKMANGKYFEIFSQLGYIWYE